MFDEKKIDTLFDVASGKKKIKTEVSLNLTSVALALSIYLMVGLLLIAVYRASEPAK